MKMTPYDSAIGSEPTSRLRNRRLSAFLRRSSHGNIRLDRRGYGYVVRQEVTWEVRREKRKTS
jgi:hypothetical protein